MSRIKNFLQWINPALAPRRRSDLAELHEEIALLAIRINGGEVEHLIAADEDQALRLLMGADSLAMALAHRFNVGYLGLDPATLTEAFRKIWGNRP